jgi:hypothetical protein
MIDMMGILCDETPALGEDIPWLADEAQLSFD